MSGADRERGPGGPGPGGRASKWDARYAFSGDTVPPPAEVLSRHAYLLPGTAGASRGDALDLACGRAGNGEWLAAQGFRVTAWDASAPLVDALRARPGSGLAEAAVRDVVRRPPEPDTFDVVVVVRFLERALCPAIERALRPGGTLFYQTFTSGLTNPDYLLGPNELLALFPGLAIAAYRERAPGPDGKAEAMLVGRRVT